MATRSTFCHGRKSVNSQKKEKIESQTGPDLLSGLPLSIVDIILARIPFRDAIRTSLLSRQWRYTWTNLPDIVIKERNPNPYHGLKCKLEERADDFFRRVLDHELKCKFKERLMNFITNALLQHKGPIHKFKLSVDFESNCPSISEWILHLSRNDIKELILEMGNPDLHEAPDVNGVYSCEKLTTLDLNNCELDPPPSTFKGFLFLRCLSLHDVYMSSDGMERLVTSSPLLERLEVSNENEYESSELRFSAPNLKYLYVYGGYTQICLYAPLLAEMSALLSNDHLTSEHQLHKRSVCNYTNVIGGLTNLEILSGNCNFVKFMSIGIESCHRTLEFHHLKDIELNDVNFEDKKEILAVARIITGAPNLHKLRISTNLEVRCMDDVASHSEAPEICFGDFGCEPDFRFEKLRTFRMDDVSGFPSELDFMQFLIESSPVLDSITIAYLSSLSTEEKENLSDELFDWCWASPNASLYVPVA